MDKKSILRAFNEHFTEFMQDIIRVFPDDNNLHACKLAIENMRKANPKLLMTTFTTEFVYKYRQQINNNNLDFFINNDYTDSVKNAASGSMILEKINLLREPVRNMIDADKDNTIKYIKNLMKLSDMYHN
tara:strand:- start:147 stop:536 length:390 start_codon:yes stop_codon:yes gene_type:complete